MTQSLQTIVRAINQVRDEGELASRVSPMVGEYFSATRWGIFFLDNLPMLDGRFQALLASGLFSVEQNPVVRYLVERHAPVHESVVVSPRVWSTICPRADHWHVMAGPIVSNGQLVGLVGCTRDRSRPAFDAENLADLSGICLHVSVWTATVRDRNISGGELRLESDRLTPRQLEIARLVALGRTNAEIGKELWITENTVKQALKRMFRKLEVSSRAEMVARLSVQ
ncbi:MAG: LuxR C-terminal-related transcriptional regulator [Cyanobacteria bacterium J06597_1]